MKVVPKLWYGKLAWTLRIEVLEHGVKGLANVDTPLFLLFKMDNSVGEGEGFAEAPFVACVCVPLVVTGIHLKFEE